MAKYTNKTYRLKSFPSWQEKRNLIFFNGLKPTNFYFNLLLSTWEGHDIYNSEAHEIAMDASLKIKNAVSSLKTISSGENAGSNRLDIVLPLLDRAIAAEQSNEISFFRQKYNQFMALDIFKNENIKNYPFLEELKDFFENFDPNKEVDYAKFLRAVNILLQNQNGQDNAKVILEYEEKRLQDMQDRLEALTPRLSERAAGLAKKYHKDEKTYRTASGKRLRHKIGTTYLSRGNLRDPTDNNKYIRDLRGILNDLKGTIDVEITNWINKNLNNILQYKDLKQQIANYIKANGLQKDNEEMSVQIKEILVRALVSYGINNITEIISQKVSESTSEKILNTLIKNQQLSGIIDIEGVYDNVFRYGKSLKYFSTKNKSDSSEGLYEALQELFKELKKPEIKAQLSDQRKKVGEIFSRQTNFKEFIKVIQRLEATVKKIEKLDKQGEKTYEMILSTKSDNSKYIEDKNKTFTFKIRNGEIINLPELMSILNNYAKAAGITQVNLHSAKNLTNLVRTLKGQFSASVKDTLSKMIKKSEDPKRLKTLFKQGLENIHVKVNAPDLAELAQGIQLSGDENSIKITWAGPNKTKNDVIQVIINTPTEEIVADLTSFFNTNVDNLENDIMPLYKEAQAEMAEQVGGALTDFIINNGKAKKYHKYEETAEYSLEMEKKILDTDKKTLESFPKLTKLLETIRENNPTASEEQIKEKQKALISNLLDFFYLSSTVKTYNNYMNNYGFLGGSLGSSILEQLETLNKFFNAAGAPLEKSDLEWLVGAIINCSSHSVVGTQYKETIEYYLGSLAIFSLFDEGLLEQIVYKNIEEKINTAKHSSMKNLHLYRLSGGYYTGSFVLARARDNLAIYLNQIQMLPEEFNQVHHGGVAILGGGVTPNDLPNKGLSFPKESDPWGKISAKAQSQAKVQVLFLAGLLDTLKTINNNMNNIELPG